MTYLFRHLIEGDALVARDAAFLWIGIIVFNCPRRDIGRTNGRSVKIGNGASAFSPLVSPESDSGLMNGVLYALPSFFGMP